MIADPRKVKIGDRIKYISTESHRFNDGILSWNDVENMNSLSSSYGVINEIYEVVVVSNDITNTMRPNPLVKKIGETDKLKTMSMWWGTWVYVKQIKEDKRLGIAKFLDSINKC
jgi:hypothetical protein